ncbi:FecR domain-containing protein [Microvirga sp. 2MCAF38]|uniref:FecR domain-containing protein n=1 Tax=Microvirga sp. 2MCAF38 TaxID=3232989 RepID=UPI003F969354
MSFRLLQLLAATSALALSIDGALAQSVKPRSGPAAGSIVAAKGGEELRFVRENAWQPAEVRQDLVDGDTLRTNTIGNLAILFADQTQIRVGRNSTLTVRDVASNDSGTTQLDLQSGTVWARAARGGAGVDIKTPSAVAAIRGTDWSLTVDGSKTSLVVLEGVVELRNAQGSVTVRQGEGAVASIGSAPTKFILVNSSDREQMLFYMTLRDAFTGMPTSSLKGPALRAERARIEAIAPDARRAGDWLSLAEIALSYDGRPIAIDALAQARRKPLDAGQRARADLVEAMIAGAERRWTEAATLFGRAEQGVKGRQRIAAAYGRYISLSLANPHRIYPEPKVGSNDPLSALAHAYIVAFKQDLSAAADVIKAARKRFPNDSEIAVAAAQLAMALNRREDLRGAVDDARRIDPEDPNVRLASSAARGDIDGEVRAAITELRKAAETAPGQSGIWNAIGLFESTLSAPIAAEEALRRAIAADPESPVAYANLAIVLLDQSRVEEAGVLIDKALSLDPSFSTGYIAKGRYLVQKGETAKGIEAILAGSAANPAYSQGLLMAAVAYYQNGDEILAQQALDNADRLDPNDPSVSTVRTAIAIDQYRADEAITAARETLQRYRLRGGDFAGIAVNKDGGSYPAEAYRFLDLSEWGRYYGDRVFDPFTGSSYFDQAAARRPNVFTTRPTVDTVQGNGADLTTFTLTMQGLFFDPLAVSGRIGRIDLVRRPFLDSEASGSAIIRDGRVGWEANGTVQGFTNEPLPTSFSFSAGKTQLDGKASVNQQSADSAAFFVGSAPSAADRFLVFGSASEISPGVATINKPLHFFEGRQDSTTMQIGGGWSHSFSDRNVLTGAVYAYRGLDKRLQTDSNLELFPLFIVGKTREFGKVEGAVAALNHAIGFGDFTLRYGAEAQSGKSSSATFTRGIVGNFDTGFTENVQSDKRDSTDFQASRLYADGFWRPSDRFEMQAGIQRTVFDAKASPSDVTVAPRVGFGFSPFEGQWLRASYQRDGNLPLIFTLAPLTTVGLTPNALPISLGGRTETATVRWDAEWSPHIFTAVEYQRQDARNLDLPISDTLQSLAIEKARIERLAATANLWLGYGIGVFGTVGVTNSEIRSDEALGHDVPFIPGKFARAGVTFVHPTRVRFTLSETFVGDRKGNFAGLDLKDYWTTDAAVSWETADRRLFMSLTFLNIFDEKYELAPDVPGVGRTVAATIKARF